MTQRLDNHIKAKESQRARDRINGIKRHEVRIVDKPQAVAELHIAVAKINRKYSK